MGVEGLGASQCLCVYSGGRGGGGGGGTQRGCDEAALTVLSGDRSTLDLLGRSGEEGGDGEGDSDE
jgi:hypothetical protein